MRRKLDANVNVCELPVCSAAGFDIFPIKEQQLSTPRFAKSNLYFGKKASTGHFLNTRCLWEELIQLRQTPKWEGICHNVLKCHIKWEFLVILFPASL